MKRLLQTIRNRLRTGLLILAGIFLASLARPGSDHFMYGLWTRSAVESDITQLGTIENGEIPFHQWSVGPGIMSAPLGLFLSPTKAFVLTGILCSSIFWACFYFGLKAYPKTDPELGCLVCFIATPIGFYCQYVSLETFLLLPAGLLFYETIRELSGQRSRIISIAFSAALLIILRPYLLPYALPAVFLHFFNQKQTTSRTVFGSILVFLIATFIAVCQLAIVNYWMTGAWYRSPYSFGDSEFKSLDFSCPHFWNVLFDPLNGMLTTHPFYVIAFAAAISIFRFSTSNRIHLITAALVLLAFAINLVFQSSWYYWWLGKVFGMRGCILVAIPASAYFTSVIGKSDLHPMPIKIGWLALLITSSSWSFLLLLDATQQYTSWPLFFQGMLRSLWKLVSWTDIAWLTAGIVLIQTTYDRIFYTQNATKQFATSFLAALLLVYFVRIFDIRNFSTEVFYGTSLLFFCASLSTRLRNISAVRESFQIGFSILLVYFFFNVWSSFRTNELKPATDIFDRRQVEFAIQLTSQVERFESHDKQLKAFLDRNRGE